MKRFVEGCSYLVILLVSTIFGYLGKSAEMALAIVAGAIAISLVNLDKFSKIKGAGFEATLKEQIEAVVAKETELFIEEDEMLASEEDKPIPNLLLGDVATRKVIVALRHHDYTWRYMRGVKKDTMLSETEILKSLGWLIDNDYTKKSHGKHGTIWSLTETGRYVAAVIDFE